MSCFNPLLSDERRIIAVKLRVLGNRTIRHKSISPFPNEDSFFDYSPSFTYKVYKKHLFFSVDGCA